MENSWRNVGTLYQIYVRSFQDSNDDGIGDLQGVISRLDYLANDLGVKAIWLSPIFVSPMKDFGYDVADYLEVDPDYGTKDDLRELVDKAHQLGMKVMLDFVPCHTSDKHAWFEQSRSSRDNPKRDFYVWRDPAPGGSPPNNWLSQSGGVSWAFDELTGQYYLHSFLSSQPDLNWDNPQVREEMKKNARYWLEFGIDGFRVDAVWGISKDPDLADDSINFDSNLPADKYGYYIHDHCKYGPNFAKYLQELASVCDEFNDRQMIFEFYPDDKMGDFFDQYQQVCKVNPRNASAFFMELIRASWHAEFLNESLDKYINYSAKNSLPVFCVGNHDQPRIASRLGERRARAMNTLNLTLPGLSVIYYGDELGMTNGVLLLEQVRDVFSPLNSCDETRDLERTPMQWSSDKNAGFSRVEPWLPINENYQQMNIEIEKDNNNSMFNMHKKLIGLRRQMPALVHGTFERVDVSNGYVLAFKREFKDQTLYILVNYADEAQTVGLPESNQKIFSSLNIINDEPKLVAFEAAIFLKG